MRPDTSDWRNDHSYGFLDELPIEGLAWECLRRHHPYQDQYASLVRARAETLPLPHEQQQRWGLRFPCKARSFRSPATSDMVAIERSSRRPFVKATRLPARGPKYSRRQIRCGA